VDGHHDYSDNNNDSISAGTTKILLNEINYHYNDDDFLHHNEDDLNHQVKDEQPDDNMNSNSHDNVRRAPSTNKRDEPVSQQAEERDSDETNTNEMIRNKKVTICNDSVFDEDI
jgi:hypothetical protein